MHRGSAEVRSLFAKNALYSELSVPGGADARSILSKRLLPDDLLLALGDNALHIIERKFQRVNGSVDEKLQTCDFKLRQYRRLVKPLGLKVTYTYVLNDWFKDEAYRDVLEYIVDVGARYYFEVVPVDGLGI